MSSWRGIAFGVAAWIAAQGVALAGDWLESECETLLTVAGTVAQDTFAWRVVSLGDVTGDGVPDLATCAPLSTEGVSAGGKVTAHSGADGSVLWTRLGNLSSGILGYELETVDWNGDGALDLLASAPFNGADGGRVLVLSGLDGALLHTLTPGIPGGSFGASIALGGDFDGDGDADVAIGSTGYDQVGAPNAGRVYVYELGSGALVEIVEAPVLAPGDEEFGIGLAFLGDVSDPPDGRDDLVVGHRDASFWTGGALVHAHDGVATSLLYGVAPVPMDFGLSGDNVDGGRDLDGDGRGDFLVGAAAADRAEARSGADGVLLSAFTGDGAGQSFGVGRMVPDADGDGRADLLIGARSSDSGASDAGKAFLYSGRTGEVLRTMSATVALRRLGREVRGIGDHDGDGIPDYAIAGTGGGTSGPPPGSFVIVGGEPPFPSHCTSLPNSTGAAATISATGSSSVSLADLVLHAAPVPNQFGVFFHGANPTRAPFGNGFRCAAGDVRRGAVVLASGLSASYAYDGSDARRDLGPFVDETRHFQYWFRDPAAGGALFDTSDALSLHVAP